MIRRALCAVGLLLFVAHANGIAIAGQGTWETTLQARDLSVDTPGVDAWFDTARNVTWMSGLGTDFSGAVSPRVHVGTFARPPETFEVFNVSGWRLPSTAELLSLRNETLGNASGLAFNSGGFDFGSPSGRPDDQLLLWASDVSRFRAQCSDIPLGPICWLAPDPEGIYFENARFFMQSGDGFFDTVQQYGITWVMGVHDGDIAAAPVPEPSTYLLLVLGLGALVFRRTMRP